MSQAKDFVDQYEHRVVKYLKINQAAVDKLRELLQHHPEYSAIRIAIDRDGCAGSNYRIEYASRENITMDDEVVEVHGKPLLYLDPKAIIFLIGSEMVYRETELESGFDFINPNEISRCSCGKSVNFSGQTPMTGQHNCLR